MSHRICARVQIHNQCKVRDLTPQQVTALTAFLSAPASAPTPPHLPVAGPNYVAPAPSMPLTPIVQSRREFNDPLKKLRLETDLKREIHREFEEGDLDLV